MADKPQLPKGQGGGSISDAMKAMSGAFSSMSGQMVSMAAFHTDFSAWADLWMEESQRSINSREELMTQLDTLVDTNRLIAENTFNSASSLAEVSQSLNVIKEFLAPISAHFAELLEETPMRDWPDSPNRVVIPQAAPGQVGEEIKPEDDKDSKKFGSGLGGMLGGLFGKGVGGAIGAFFAKIGVGLGVLGIGLATITGALFLGAKAVETFGEGLSDIATGLDDLNKVEVDTEQFEKLGEALGALVGGVGIGGATGILILAQTNFVKLAEGIERLNRAEFDPANLEAAGQAIGGFLEEMGTFGALGGGIVGAMVDDNLIPLADGIKALAVAGNALPADFEAKMSTAGTGIGKFVDGVGAQFLDASVVQMIDENLPMLGEGLLKLSTAAVQIDDSFPDKMALAGEGLNTLMSKIGGKGFFGFLGRLGDTAVAQAIDDNLPALADGVNALAATNADEAFVTKMKYLGAGFQALLDGTDDISGAAGIQMIDDNLIDLTKGINSLNTVDSALFKEKAIQLGAGFQSLLDGTDDVAGAQGLQMIDDNLIDLAAGVNALNDVDAMKFLVQAGSLGLGFKEILTPFTLFSMQDIREMGEFATRLKDVGTGLTSLNSIDKDMLAPVAEVMKYATDLLSGTGVEQLGNALDQVDKAARNLSDEGDFPDEFDNFESFVDRLKVLETLNIDKLSRLGIAMSQISGAASSLTMEESQGRQQNAALASARGAAEAAPPVVNVNTDNSISSMSQTNVRGGGGGVRASVSPPTTPSKNVFV